MKHINIAIVIGTTALIGYHSFNAWEWMTNDTIIAISTTLVFDLMAVYLWHENAKLLALTASVVVVSTALLHLSSNVVGQLDKIESVQHTVQANDDLLKIGRGAAKYGNHEAVNKVLNGIKQTEVETGSYTYFKLLVSTLVQALMIVTAVAGQIYATRRLKTEDVTKQKGVELQPRNKAVDTSIKGLAVKLSRDINKYISANNMSASYFATELLGENRIVVTRLNDTVKTGKGLSKEKLMELQEKVTALA